MSKLANWREEFEHRLGVTSAEMKLLEDLIDGKIKPKPAARSFTENVDMTEEFHSPLYHKVIIITTLAVCSFDSAIQKIMVQLASEIRTLRKRSLKLGNKIPLSEVLVEMGEIIREWWPCKYLPSSSDLPSDANANTIIYLALWSDSHDLKRGNEYPRWISINEFSARLTKANLCDWTHKATFLLDDLLDNLELRENAILFSVALSAAAQYILHAAFNVLTFCKKHRGYQGQKFRWEEWKAIFKEA